MQLTDQERKMLAVSLMPAGLERDRLESTITFSCTNEQDAAYGDLLDRLKEGA